MHRLCKAFRRTLERSLGNSLRQQGTVTRCDLKLRMRRIRNDAHSPCSGHATAGFARFRGPLMGETVAGNEMLRLMTLALTEVLNLGIATRR